MNDASTKVSVLTVSPFESDLVILSNMISHSAWTFQSAHSIEEAKSSLINGSVQVVLCEASLPDGSWQDLLEVVQGVSGEAPEMIVFSRNADDQLWATVLNLGAWDVLTKPFHPKEVFRSIHSAWSHRTEMHGEPVRKPVRAEGTKRMAAFA